MSTGGTAVTLEEVGISVKKVEELTAFPEMVCKKENNRLLMCVYIMQFVRNQESSAPSTSLYGIR